MCRVRGPVPRSWGTYMDFWGISPWADPEDLGIRGPLHNYSEVGGQGETCEGFCLSEGLCNLEILRSSNEKGHLAFVKLGRIILRGNTTVKCA